MPRDPIQKIESRVTAARAKLLAVVEGLDAAAWDWCPEDGRWSVRLTLAHVGSAQWSHLEVAQRLAARKPVDLPGFELDEWNAAQVATRAGWTVEQILDDLEAAQRATLAFLDELDVDQLVITGSHPALGEVSVEQVLRVMGVHDNMHRRDVLNLLREMEEGR